MKRFELSTIVGRTLSAVADDPRVFEMRCAVYHKPEQPTYAEFLGRWLQERNQYHDIVEAVYQEKFGVCASEARQTLDESQVVEANLEADKRYKGVHASAKNASNSYHAQFNKEGL